MNDKELASKACALLPQTRMWEAYCDCLTDEEVVNDWRVAGALMERVVTSDAPYTMSVAMQPTRKFMAWFRGEGVEPNESLPRAIIEACVEALT
jgi:hypothetical protein